jgi:hypothetical protein
VTVAQSRSVIMATPSVRNDMLVNVNEVPMGCGNAEPPAGLLHEAEDALPHELLPCPLMDEIFWGAVVAEGMDRMQAVAQSFEETNWTWLSRDWISCTATSINLVSGWSLYDDDDFKILRIQPHLFIWRKPINGAIRTFKFGGYAIPVELSRRYAMTLPEARRRKYDLIQIAAFADSDSTPPAKRRRRAFTTGLLDPETPMLGDNFYSVGDS